MSIFEIKFFMKTRRDEVFYKIVNNSATERVKFFGPSYLFEAEEFLIE